MKVTNKITWIVTTCMVVFAVLARVTLSERKDTDDTNMSTTSVPARDINLKIQMSHGPVKDGLAAFLICERKQFRVGEQVVVIYGIVLLGGSEKQEIMVCPPLLLVAHDFSWLSVKGADGKDVPHTGSQIDYVISDHKKIMRRLLRRQFVGNYDSVEQNYNLSDPGTYTVKWNYKAIPGYSWWQGELISNEIQIEIVK